MLVRLTPLEQSPEQIDAETRSDAALLVGIRARDESALAQLFDRYGDIVFRFAMMRLRDRDAAMTVVNEVLLAVWKRPDSFKGRSRLKSWILGIAHHKVLDLVRCKSLDTVELTSRNGGVQAPEEGSAPGSVRRLLQESWGELEPGQREILYMTLCEDLTYEEIAALLGLPEGTVKSRIHYAKKALRALLEGKGIQL